MLYNFIHIPKTGGSSLYNLIGGDTVIAYCGHIRAKDVRFFCFVRNPYNRLADAYYYLMNGGSQTELDLSYKEILSKYEGFKDFVLHIQQDNLIEKIIHIKPMWWFICDDNSGGKVYTGLVENIFKIEEPEKIDEFLQSLGYDKKFSETFVNVTDFCIPFDQIERSVIDEINKIYDFDFELFDYKKILPQKSVPV